MTAYSVLTGNRLYARHVRMPQYANAEPWACLLMDAVSRGQHEVIFHVHANTIGGFTTLASDSFSRISM